MTKDTIELQDPREAFARKVVDRLSEAGHIAYFAGGCVRDMLLDRKPKDFDVATDATPDRIREIFGRRRTLAIGAAFGVISVLGRKDQGEEPIEVATFRCDGSYSDGRRPDNVVYSSPQEDAQRRDFTINGLFFDPKNNQVIDYVGGEADLKRGVINAIGDAEARIAEDKLRMLRAVRFSAVFGFGIGAETMDAVANHASEIEQVSGERIGAELRRLFACDGANTGVGLLLDSGLARIVFPVMFQRCDSSEQGVEVRRRLLLILERRRSCDFVSGLACCIHALTAEQDECAAAVDDVVDRWRLSNDEADRIRFALASRDTVLHANEYPWSVVQPVLSNRYAADAVELASSISALEGSSPEAVAFCIERLGWDRSRLDPPHLIDGNRLQELGLRPGPEFKKIIARVRSMQLDAELSDVDSAEGFVRENYIT